MSLRSLLPPRDARPWIGLTALAILGLVLIGLGTMGPAQVTWDVAFTTPWWLHHAGKLGELIFVGGVIGAVTRTLALAGVFRKGVEESFATREFRDSIQDAAHGALVRAVGDERFNAPMIDLAGKIVTCDTWMERRSDLPDLWRALTRRIYMPFLAEKLANGNGGARELAEALEGSIRDRFTYDRRLYLRDYNRRQEIVWADETRRVVQINDTVDFTIVPFVADEAVEWIVQRVADSVLPLGDYAENVSSFEINHCPTSPASTRLSEGGKTEIRVYALNGSPEYHLFMRRSISWVLDDDPTYEHISAYVTHRARLTIVNRAQGLNVLFNAVGGSKLLPFKEVCGRELLPRVGGHGEMIGTGGESTRATRGAILPNQGYVLVFHRPTS
jgi:hypothetical protein